MKKYFMFAAVVTAGMLASCSSESLTGSDPKIETPDQADLVPIEIGVASSQTTGTTRGTGTVGGTTVAANIWNGERVKVLMFNINDDGSPSLNYTKDGANNPLYDATMSLVTPLTVENTNTGVAKEPTDPAQIGDGKTYKVKYYPAAGRSDFWGYYLGGYGTGANAPAGDGSLNMYVDAALATSTTTEANATCVATNFVIDGTHDLLVGKAISASELTTTTTPASTADGADAIYSAKAARKNIQPNIIFKHLLTRLTFKAKVGNKAAADAQVTVTGIKVHSKTTGKLIAAYKYNLTSEPNRIVWDSPVMTDDPVPVATTDYKTYPSLTLKKRTSGDDRTLTALTSVALTWTGDATTGSANEVNIGEALLVAPQDKYYIEIEYKVNEKAARQWYKGGTGADQYDPGDLTGADSEIAMPAYTVTIPTSGSSITTFEAGKSYEIGITLYGPEEIKITTTLTAWVSGGTDTIVAE